LVINGGIRLAAQYMYFVIGGKRNIAKPKFRREKSASSLVDMQRKENLAFFIIVIYMCFRQKTVHNEVGSKGGRK